MCLDKVTFSPVSSNKTRERKCIVLEAWEETNKSLIKENTETSQIALFLLSR